MGYTAELTREANCFFVCLFICLFCFVFVFFMSLVVTEHKLFGAIRNKFGNLEVYKCKRNVLKLGTGMLMPGFINNIIFLK